MNGMNIDYDRHEVYGASLPVDSRYIGPLLGNDELKLVLDARGCMHDFTPPAPWPPPRIVWTGRRHNQRIDRYNSNQFEYGFFEIRLADEESLPPVTSWRQQLHPGEGYVETVIERAGGMREYVVTFLHLQRNLIVCQRRYEGLPAGIRPLVTARYVFCQLGADAIPFRATWTPLPADANGMTAHFTADGHRRYTGCLAFFTVQPCATRAVANRLELTCLLDADGSVTVFLAMEDDLGDDPQLVTVQEGDWMPVGVREVHRENEERARTRQTPDPDAMLTATRQHVVTVGFAGLLAEQRAAWQDYVARYQLTLPESAPLLAAAVRGAIYHVRCGYSHYSWGSSPFNQSWGAHYAWNERYPVEGLMSWGVNDMPMRVMEWRRRILPFLSMRAAARGAFYHHSAVEPGTTTGERNATNFYELFLPGLIANYLDQWSRYTGCEEDLRRYYPVIRECAEFFRYWLLVELPGNNLMTVPLIDVNESIYPVQDGTFTICAAARLFDLVARSAERLGEDAELLPTWQRYRDMAILLVRHIMARETAGSACPVWGCYQELELETIPPPDLVVDTAIRDWRDDYKRAYAGVDQFKSAGQNVAGDHSKPRNWPWGAFQQAYFAASLGQPDQVEQALERGFKVLLPFGGQCESAEEDFSRIDHPWFTTASGALLRALGRMFLFPQDDRLRLFPGIPESWRDFSMTMPAHQGVTVTARVEAGCLTSLAITSVHPREGRPLSIGIPRRWLPSSLSPLPNVEWNTAESDATWSVAQVTLEATGEWLPMIAIPSPTPTAAPSLGEER